MSARDRYTSNFECPNCKQAGILHISEDDHPYIKDLHREVDCVDGNFTASMKGKLDIKVICKECGEKFIF